MKHALAEASFVPALFLFSLLCASPAAESVPVTVRINGSGKVAPDTTGKSYTVGKHLVLTPKPDRGSIFAGWDNYECITCNTFTVVPGLEIVANFIPDPFPALAGEYGGLIYALTNAITHDRSGGFSFKISAKGKASGEIWFGGRSSRIYDVWDDGAILRDGHVSGWYWNIAITRGDVMDGNFRQTLTSRFELDFANPAVIRGQLTDARWDKGQGYPATFETAILGERNIFSAKTNPCPLLGAYTLALHQDPAGAFQGGDGYATLQVSSSGQVTLAGKMPGGGSITQKTPLGGTGRIPFYSSLDGRRGSILGWVELGSSGTASEITWTQSPQSGLAHRRTCTAELSKFLAGGLVIGTGSVHLAGPGLNDAQTIPFSVAPGKASATGPNGFRMSFNRRTGTFTGVCLAPNSSGKIKFEGALIQNLGKGFGFYRLADSRTGWVTVLLD